MVQVHQQHSLRFKVLETPILGIMPISEGNQT